MPPLDAELSVTRTGPAGAALEPPWVFSGLAPEDIPARAEAIGLAYRTYGVVIFPGMLAAHPALMGFVSAARYLFGRIFARYGATVASDEDLGDILVRLKRSLRWTGGSSLTWAPSTTSSSRQTG